jgi:antitoxin component YwqK of YwqJK toxin-antitoxin module
MDELILKREDKWVDRLKRSFMSYRTVFIIIAISFLPNVSIAQGFGCYDINSSNKNNLDGVYNKFSIEDFFLEINWKEYFIESGLADGHFTSYFNDKTSCTKIVKMEGPIVSGLQEGKWKFYINKSCFFQGNFINGRKEGVWLGYNMSNEGDSVCNAKIEFKNDLIDGKAIYYFSSGKIHKMISYQNGVKNGKEIVYFENDTAKVDQIKEFKEYSNGVLHGKYLVYYSYNPLDTLEYGTYLNGKRNGKFLFSQQGKLIVNFSNDLVDGKLMKFYPNGQLALEADYKNNLPYNIIQINDSCGKLLESNTLKEGNGWFNCYYDDGKLISHFEYKNQMISGNFFRYYKAGNIMEAGLLFTNNEKNYKKVKLIQQYDDLNLFSAWQLNFTKGTNYSVYDNDKSIKYKIFSEHIDTLNDDIILYNNYEDGIIKHKDQLWRGLKYGQEKSYYDNDSVQITGNYKIIDAEDGNKNSVKNGTFKYYHFNGHLKAEITYLNGKETGKSYYYDDSGLLKRIKVNEDNGEVYNVFDGDTVNRIDIDGRRQGKWINIPNAYSEDKCFDLPNQIKYFKDDKPIGTWQSYSYDGKHLTEKIIWQDSLIAYCMRWGYSNKLMDEGIMFNQIENGEWKEYDFKKGYLKYKGQYKCGQRDGIWQEFDKKRKLIKKIEYKEGQKINKP